MAPTVATRPAHGASRGTAGESKGCSGLPQGGTGRRSLYCCESAAGADGVPRRSRFGEPEPVSLTRASRFSDAKADGAPGLLVWPTWRPVLSSGLLHADGPLCCDEGVVLPYTRDGAGAKDGGLPLCRGERKPRLWVVGNLWVR